MNRTIIPILAVGFAVACGQKDKRVDVALTDGTGPVPQALPTHADPGPQLERKTGRLEAKVRPAGEAVVDRMEKHDGFVLAVVPLAVEVLPAEIHRASYVVDAGGVHASAFGWAGQGLVKDSVSVVGLVVRFQGDKLPAKFTVRWHEVDRSAWRANRLPGTVAEVSVGVPNKVPITKGLDAAFWNAAAQSFDRQRSSRGFYGYARNRAKLLADGTGAARPAFDRRPSGSDMHEMMELYSGMTSVNEALQSDRGLRVRGHDAKERTQPIASVERLKLVEHPWPRMIEELGGQPQIEPLAAYVAADMAYLHFADLRTFVKLIRDLDDWVSPVAQWMEDRGGASHFMSRYEEQLVLERSGLAEKLGHVAASGIAVVTSDPYLREGTDVSMIFRVQSRAALVATLGAFEASSRKRHPAMKKTTLQVGGVQVQRLHTPDGRVNQYRAEYGDVLVVSNSAGAIGHLISAHAGKVPNLTTQGDFRYLRTVYPWDTKAEDGFLFLSDAFVARAVSPEVKILEARRMHARADLFAINYAAILRGWVDGKRSSSAQDLVKSGYVQNGEFEHSSGDAIEFSAAGGARSAWGTVARLTPIRDLQVGNVSEREMKAYGQFRQTYEQYWRAYLDPIAARITRSDDGKRLGVDARMLPLINSSEYDQLIREVGLQKIVPPATAPGLQWTFAIGKEADIRRKLDGMARGFVPGENVSIGWLGDWVSVGVADRSGLWDMALRTRMIPALVDSEREGILAMLEQFSTFPIYAQIHVASKIGLGALLTGLKAWTSDAAPGMISWGQSEPYREIPIVTIDEGAQGSGELRGLAIHYATVDDVFVVAFDRATLQTQLDRLLLGGAPKTPTGPPSAGTEDAQATMNVEFASESWLSKTLMGVAEQALLGHHELVMQGYEVLWRGFGNQVLSGESTRELGVAYLGYEPRSPHGGRVVVEKGFLTHSIYGDSARPNMPEVPIGNSPVSKVFETVSRVAMSLEFDGEGDHRGLHSTVSWVWK